MKELKILDSVTLGARIREQRKKRKLTLKTLAEMTDIGTVYLGEIERGLKMPSIKTFIKIVNILEISADILLCDEVNAAKPYILNDMTEKMKDLSPQQLKMVNGVFHTMLENMYEIGKTDSADWGDDD
jgi:transcriptional regulator with XRE-family HTH domain